MTLCLRFSSDFPVLTLTVYLCYNESMDYLHTPAMNRSLVQITGTGYAFGAAKTTNGSFSSM